MSDLSAAVVRMGRWDRHTHTQHQLALFPGCSRAQPFASTEDLAQYFSSEVWKI